MTVNPYLHVWDDPDRLDIAAGGCGHGSVDADHGPVVADRNVGGHTIRLDWPAAGWWSVGCSCSAWSAARWYRDRADAVRRWERHVTASCTAARLAQIDMEAE